MDRRKFIKIGIPVVVASTASNRLFGHPDSLKTKSEIIDNKRNDMIKYRLSNLQLKPHQWNDLIGLSNTWESIVNNKEDCAQFNNDPQKYLGSKGISFDDLGNLHAELDALRIFSDHEIFSAVKDGNMDKYFSLLADKKIINTFNNKSQLRKKIDLQFTNMFKAQSLIQSEEELMNNPLFATYKELGLLDKNRDLSILPGNTTVPVVALLLVVVLAAATAAAVAGGGVLVLAAAAVVSQVGVYTSGPSNNFCAIDTDLENKSVIHDLKVAAEISTISGNKELTESITKNIKAAEDKLSAHLNDMIDLAVKYDFMNFDGVDEKKVRSALNSVMKKHFLQVV